MCSLMFVVLFRLFFLPPPLPMDNAPFAPNAVVIIESKNSFISMRKFWCQVKTRLSVANYNYISRVWTLNFEVPNSAMYSMQFILPSVSCKVNLVECIIKERDLDKALQLQAKSFSTSCSIKYLKLTMEIYCSVSFALYSVLSS